MQRQGVDRIAIQLPGVQNSAEVNRLLGKTATLEFRHGRPDRQSARGGGRAVACRWAPSSTTTRNKQPVLLKREVVVTGDQLTDATVPAEQQDGPAVVGPARRARRRRDAEEHRGEHRPSDGGGVHRPSREKNRDQGAKVGSHVTERGHQPRDHPRRVQQQFQITGVTPIEGRELALLLRAGGLAAPLSIGRGARHRPEPRPGQHRQGRATRMVFGMLARCSCSWRSTTSVFGLVADLVLIATWCC